MSKVKKVHGDGEASDVLRLCQLRRWDIYNFLSGEVTLGSFLGVHVY